ncbi:MAG: methyl-accepting chemotaxis protein, partial [Magnetococcales bacterium]|nr:methyl-accepting chemotaxis protein [Magnetococcales bacterium]
RYLATINHQIATFSENRMVVEAMQGFSGAFRSYRQQAGVTPERLTRMRSELRTYYSNDFSTEYRAQNGGRSPEITPIFNSMDDDAIALQHAFIKANPNPLGSKHLLDSPGDESDYTRLHADVHPIVRNYLERFGYYDIFLADLESGDIVYSVFKELDYATSLKDGAIAGTNFAEAFRRAAAADKNDAVIVVDFAQYWPSYMAPAGFVASPIFDGERKVGVALFQFPIDRLNTIMSERSGLGKTGETYLIGNDLKMRSDSYLDPKNHSVAASFRNPDSGKVETDAARRAIGGRKGAEVIIDYNGNPVLSAYTPLELHGLTWALLAEIDMAEAFNPIKSNGEAFYSLYKEKYGYYDLFLIDPSGHIFYSVEEEPDYQTNIVSGKYRDSNLGTLIREVITRKQFGIVDFAPYAPSNDAPAAFIAQPVLNDGGEIEVIVALQLPTDFINTIMQQREGMGDSGETYLVGGDNRMRSNSYLDKDGRSVEASFAGSVEKNGVDSDATRAALSGKTGEEIIIDYNGNPVLSAYAPLDAAGLTWALIAEIDEEEVERPLAAFSTTLLVIFLVLVVVIAVVALLIAGNITGPLIRCKSLFVELAKGNLSVQCSLNRKDEVGALFSSLSDMTATLRTMVNSVHDTATKVTGQSQALSEFSAKLTSGVNAQAASVEQTSAAMEQMIGNIHHNSENAQQTSGLSKEAAADAASGGKAVSQSVEAMQQIAEKISIIEEIARQTNLL